MADPVPAFERRRARREPLINAEEIERGLCKDVGCESCQRARLSFGLPLLRKPGEYPPKAISNPDKSV